MEHGTLSIVATPIGNLQDTTLRSLEVLRGVAAVLAEDTRRTAIFLRHFAIPTPLVSFHEHTDPRKRRAVIERLTRGESLALVTDAGTPGIADPGNLLVADAAAAGIPIIPIPGPSALTAALSVCGFPTGRVVFYGFLPHKRGRQALLANIAQDPATVVVFESPYRIVKLLRALAAVAPDRGAVVFRELTKAFEETLRGTLGELAAILERAPAKQRGEFVVVLAPKEKSGSHVVS